MRLRLMGLVFVGTSLVVSNSLVYGSLPTKGGSIGHLSYYVNRYGGTRAVSASAQSSNCDAGPFAMMSLLQRPPEPCRMITAGTGFSVDAAGGSTSRPPLVWCSLSLPPAITSAAVTVLGTISE